MCSCSLLVAVILCIYYCCTLAVEVENEKVSTMIFTIKTVTEEHFNYTYTFFANNSEGLTEKRIRIQKSCKCCYQIIKKKLLEVLNAKKPFGKSSESVMSRRNSQTDSLDSLITHLPLVMCPHRLVFHIQKILWHEQRHPYFPFIGIRREIINQLNSWRYRNENLKRPLFRLLIVVVIISLSVFSFWTEPD